MDVRFQPAGRLVLPSGRLIAAEPLANGVPFDRTVAPGEYPPPTTRCVTT